jgi:Sulfotransferase family
VNLIYVVGLGRSGTTVVSEYLANHTRGWCLGEVVNIFEYGLNRNELCQCGEPFNDCPFWRAIGKLAFGGWREANGHTAYEVIRQIDTLQLATRGMFQLLTSTERGQISRYSAAHLAICRAASALTGVTTIVDSSKHPAVALWLARRFPPLRTLHVVRDSRAVAWSWGKRVARPESGSMRTYMDRFDARTSAKLWNRTNLAAEAIQRTALGATRMRYEDFCANPEWSAQRAVHALFPSNEVGMRAGTPSGDRFEHSPHAIGGNPMRFKSNIKHVRIDSEWQRAMASATVAAITRRTFPLLARYNYVQKWEFPIFQ